MAINKVYTRAASAMEKGRYRYEDIGNDMYSVSNTRNGNKYKFKLKMANCECIDRLTNVYNIPCIHAMFLILRLKLNWNYFDISVRRNIRNSLIKPSDDGWELLGPPGYSEDRSVKRFWEQGSNMEADFKDDYGDDRNGISNLGYSDPMNYSPAKEEDSRLVDHFPVEDTFELARLPTGKTERRLVKENFQRIHNSAGRIKETVFNLQCAMRFSSAKNKFAAEWIKKADVLGAVQQKLSEAESMLMIAAGAAGTSYPVVSSLETVRASNKVSGVAQKQRRPFDVRYHRQKRERVFEVTRKQLNAVQTPLVKANRPNKRRKSEASRNQKNYKIAAKKTKIPKSLHPSLNLRLSSD